MDQSENKRLQCHLCEFNTIYPASLSRHHLRHTGEKPFKCELCSFSSIQKAGLINHMLKHTGQEKEPVVKKSDRPTKVHYCPECSYVTRQKSHMTDHAQTHLQVKTFKCDQCSFSSFRKRVLNSHKLIHIGKPCHQCPECPYLTPSTTNLRKHLLSHTNNKFYKCPFENCNFSSNHSNVLKNHLTIHTGEKEYKCSECTYATYLQSRLNAHMKRHKEEIPTEKDYLESSELQTPAFSIQPHVDLHIELEANMEINMDSLFYRPYEFIDYDNEALF